MSIEGLRTCPGCGLPFAMLYICERCGRCDARDLPRDADRSAPCCAGDRGTCIKWNWRAAAQRADAEESKHITAQLWIPEQREDGVYLIGEDGSVILKLCRSDHGSDLMIAGYIMGLQGKQLPPPSTRDESLLRKEPP